LHVCLGTNDEERSGHMQLVESCEVDIRFVHYVKRSSLGVALLANDDSTWKSNSNRGY
jgi:hypothetical protein